MKANAFVVAVVLGALASTAQAEGLLSGVITRMSIGPASASVDTALVITVSSEIGTTPACAAGTPTLMAYDLAKDSARAQAQLLTAAHIVGQNVQVFGTGQCTIYPHIEDALYMLTDR